MGVDLREKCVHTLFLSVLQPFEREVIFHENTGNAEKYIPHTFYLPTALLPPILLTFCVEKSGYEPFLS